MSALRGVVAGVLGLTLLDAVVSSESAANNLGTFATLFGGLVNRLVNPAVPLIPNRRTDGLLDGGIGNGTLLPSVSIGKGGVSVGIGGGGAEVGPGGAGFSIPGIGNAHVGGKPGKIIGPTPNAGSFPN